MRMILTFTFIAAICMTSFSQDVQKTEIKNQAQSYSYAYIEVEGKSFSKKLKVDVDFGEMPEQIELGKEYSGILTNKKSYAAILNYMSGRQFELVETRDNTYMYNGTVRIDGIVFIMRKKND